MTEFPYKIRKLMTCLQMDCNYTLTLIRQMELIKWPESGSMHVYISMKVGEKGQMRKLGDVDIVWYIADSAIYCRQCSI